MRWFAGVVLLMAALGGLALSQSSYDDVSHGGSLLLFTIAILGVFAFFSWGYGASPQSRINWFPAHGTVRWAVGGVVGVAAIVGLFHAAAAQPGTFAYYNGLGLFLVGVAYDFMLLKDWFDRQSDSPP